MIKAGARNLGGGFRRVTVAARVSGSLNLWERFRLRSRPTAERGSRASSPASQKCSVPSRQWTASRSGISTGSLTCLIGPNGAGKSTLLGCISGFLSSTRAAFASRDGRSRGGLPPPCTAGAGDGLPDDSAAQRAQRARQRGCRRACPLPFGLRRSMLRPPWQRREQQRVWEEAHRALETVGLEGRSSDPAAVLPLGQLRLLAIARALAQRPSVLLLDEPQPGYARERRRG